MDHRCNIKILPISLGILGTAYSATVDRHSRFANFESVLIIDTSGPHSLQFELIVFLLGNSKIKNIHKGMIKIFNKK